MKINSSSNRNGMNEIEMKMEVKVYIDVIQVTMQDKIYRHYKHLRGLLFYFNEYTKYLVSSSFLLRPFYYLY